MPTYHYKARDRAGALIMGSIEAASYDGAGSQIENLGYLPIAIKEETRESAGTQTLSDIFGGRVTDEDMVMFTFQMSTLIGAGIPLVTGLKVLSRQLQSKKLRAIMGQAARDIEGGGTLSESLAKHPKVFPTLYTNMIRAGEASGQLEKIFTRLGELVEHESETREKIKSALRYPKMVLGALVVAFIIIMTFVVPRFVVVFTKFKIALPLPTKIMIALNTIIQGYWVFLAAIVIMSIIFIRWFITTSLGRYYWHYLQIRLYVVGPILQKAALSRFTHILGTLIQSGLPIIENLHITSMAIGNDVISSAVRKIRDGVQAGKGLAEGMRDIPLFTPLVVQMIAIGETTGELDTMLLKVSRYYDMEVDYGTKKLSSYIEPLLTLALGVMVLFFALAVFMPMWDLTKIAGAGR